MNIEPVVADNQPKMTFISELVMVFGARMLYEAATISYINSDIVDFVATYISGLKH